MAALQSASLELEAGAFVSRVIHRALEIFSSLKHVLKENAQVMSKLEKLRGKKNLSMSNLSYLLTRASKD